jgi:uncharacterized glyoxalase superfamily protein PhnB
MTAISATPIFRSFDESRAREFYVDFLGFEVEFEHRFAPDTPLYLGLKFGACTLHLSEHFGDASPGGHLRVQVADAPALIAALRAKSYRQSRPGGTMRQPWGSDECTINDPFGNRITFYSDAS